MSFQKLEHNPYPESEMIERSKTFFDRMIQRRTIRDFSDRPIPIKIIENAKSEDVYKKVLDLFPDAELVDVKLKDNE